MKVKMSTGSLMHVCFCDMRCGCNVMTPLVVDLIITVDLLTPNIDLMHLYPPMIIVNDNLMLDIIHLFTKYDFYDITSYA